MLSPPVRPGLVASALEWTSSTMGSSSFPVSEVLALFPLPLTQGGRMVIMVTRERLRSEEEEREEGAPGVDTCGGGGVTEARPERRRRRRAAAAAARPKTANTKTTAARMPEAA